jgi:hypothetical protein
MKKRFLVSFVVISFVVLLSGCAKVPQAELDAVNAAIEDARTTGADVYLPTEFAALQDSMNVINQMVEAQKGKLFKSYKAVSAKIAGLTAAAATTKGNVEAKKVEVKNECDTLTVELTKLVGTAKAYVAGAPRGKEGAAAVDAIKTEVGNFETALTQEVPAKLTAGDLMGALDQLKAMKEKVNGVIGELSAAYEKVGKKLPVVK